MTQQREASKAFHKGSDPYLERRQEGCLYETFVMTGESIVQTSPRLSRTNRHPMNFQATFNSRSCENHIGEGCLNGPLTDVPSSTSLDVLMSAKRSEDGHGAGGAGNGISNGNGGVGAAAAAAGGGGGGGLSSQRTPPGSEMPQDVRVFCVDKTDDLVTVVSVRQSDGPDSPPSQRAEEEPELCALHAHSSSPPQQRPQTLPLNLRHDELDLDNRLPSPDPEAQPYTPKGVDLPSAQRLSKRLFNLEGFRRSDVAHHLAKKNEFSRLVAEEYLKYFEFKGDMLDQSLRKFLRHFPLTGETQERERVLEFFAKRYVDCNPSGYGSVDACHTLTCAIMLLNTDLHGPNTGAKMTLTEFIDNLAGLNDNSDFPKDLLRSLYVAIKNDPLQWALDDETLPSEEKRPQPEPKRMAGQNPFLQVPDPNTSKEYKKGWVMRKSCLEADGNKTPFGRRGWKMFYASLRDLALFLYKDDDCSSHHYQVVHIHHAVAVKASDYKKKRHVFRLHTADWAQFLFHTSDPKELQDWVDTINMVAASLSSPPLPGGIGSQQKFQRPLLLTSKTRYTLREQLAHHENKVKQLDEELRDHRSTAPDKGVKQRAIQEYLDKETYLEYELQRYRTYVTVLQSKLGPYIEDEPTIPSETDSIEHATSNCSSPGKRLAKPVQRSLSDRYSYRAAIYGRDSDSEFL